MSQEKNFLWKREEDGEKVLLDFLNIFIEKNKMISTISEDLKKYTSTRLFDWIDHFILEKSTLMENKLLEKGFLEEENKGNYKVFHFPGTILPRVLLKDSSEGIAVIVDSIGDFIHVRGIEAFIEGSPFSQYRRACVSKENGTDLWVVERRGSRTMEPVYNRGDYLEKYFMALEKWNGRPRNLENTEEAFNKTIEMTKEISASLGRDLSAYLFCECERKYWQSRNRAAQIQKNRHDRAGMGWANHDHHTFRSSRKYFSKLIQFFQILGFECREKFYAGEQAGWGAQVMENLNAGFTLFLDVDLSPEELDIDFGTRELSERDSLGTIGLWCLLHGESILSAGLHHLAGKFLFDELTSSLKKEGIDMMTPFSNFSYLRQAFTNGEMWEVGAEKISSLLESKKIDENNGERFRENGAIGSHLENLQRREGFKGFNQENVSFIIKETDPRKS